MTSGAWLTEEEKEKIRDELPGKSKRQLAKELNRSRQTIYNFVKDEHLEE